MTRSANRDGQGRVAEDLNAMSRVDVLDLSTVASHQVTAEGGALIHAITFVGRGLLHAAYRDGKLQGFSATEGVHVSVSDAGVVSASMLR